MKGLKLRVGGPATAGTAPAMLASAPPALMPARIASLSIQNFRAYPGSANPIIDLGGKNLLVYGENGSGKSSIFHALNQFFSVSEYSKSERLKLLADGENIFSKAGLAATQLQITFDDGHVVQWNESKHPADTKQDDRIVRAAYLKAMLDYRSLLDVNYRYLGQKINLFPAFMAVLLRDFPVPYAGSQRELARIWKELDRVYTQTHIQSRRNQIDAMLSAINDAIDSVLPNLKDSTNALIKAMGWDDVEITAFEFSHLNCPWGWKRVDRKIRGQKVRMELSQGGEEISAPHHFLNEARLSAIALSLYLAGRQICSQTTLPDTPRLLVLDDVLIGLDQSNRLPVLRMLTEQFSEWQIILLTHDRVWFEMARTHLPNSGDQAWTSLELFEGREPDGTAHPVQRPKDMNVIPDNLALAKKFLADHYDNAAAVHTRMAFEQSLKKFCERKGVPVAFKLNPKDLTTENLMNAIDSWLGDPKRAVPKATLDPHLIAARASRTVILNPYSHSTPVTLVTAEIQSAIDAVETLDAKFKEAFPK